MDIVTNVKDSKVAGNVQAKPLTQKQVEDNKKLKKACADFEAILAYNLFKTMRQTIPTGGAINKITGKDTFDMLMDQKVAEELSKKNGGLGIQKIMYNQLVVKANNNNGQ
ncbi:MAG: rod-binding protein [Syntrophales bacterium]